MTSLADNRAEIDLLLFPYGLNLPTYLALTDGAPTDPLALPPKHMDYEEYVATCDKLDMDIKDAVQAQKNLLLKQQWHHLFELNPINAKLFRHNLGFLLDQRRALSRLWKSHGRFRNSIAVLTPSNHVADQEPCAPS